MRDRLLRLLTDKEVEAVALLTAVCERAGYREGPAFHREVASWMRAGAPGGADLKAWLAERGMGSGIAPSTERRAARQAAQWRRQEIWGLTWKEGGKPADAATCRPAVLFGMGPWPGTAQRVALFNSRKPRQLDPEADWLKALRHALPELVSRGFGFASSRGTLTYDLVTAYAANASAPLLLAMSEPVERLMMERAQPVAEEIGALCHTSATALTCRCVPMSCPKTTSLVCRDRLLALLADAHCVLELRPGGNLERVLDESSRQAPRFRLSLLPPQPEEKGAVLEGEAFPPLDTAISPSARRVRLVESDHGIDRRAYLYHYTRSCPGPWPGETPDSFLRSILQGHPLAGHSALDTLIRILLEGRLRASNRLTRGSEATVSWTSRPPDELAALQRWNRTLARRTAEPYGIAVSRTLLQRLGARPTIYAPDASYERLASADRFRFQKHEPPRCRWKHEREWRLRGDLLLADIAAEDAWLFVPDEAAARRLSDFTDCPFRIRVERGGSDAALPQDLPSR